MSVNASTLISPGAYNQIHQIGRNFVHAYAIDDDRLVLLYLTAATTSVDAARATMVLGHSLSLSNSPYARFFGVTKVGYDYLRSRDDMRRLDHAMITIRSLDHVVPEFPTYVMGTLEHATAHDDPYASIVIGQRLPDLINVAIFDEWKPKIIETAQAEKLITRCNYLKGVNVYRLENSESRWTKLVQDMLRNNTITFPKGA